MIPSKIIVALFFCGFPSFKLTMNASFTQQDIIEYLERNDQETYHFFIDFEHPYFFTAGSRLSLYADESRWAIVFEKSGYSTGNSCGAIELAYFGNCLKHLKSQIPGDTATSNLKQIIIINDRNFEQIVDGDFPELVSVKKDSIKARNLLLPVEHDANKYYLDSIKIRSYNNPEALIDFPSLIRYLDKQYPETFRATDEEVRMCLPDDLPS